MLSVIHYLICLKWISQTWYCLTVCLLFACIIAVMLPSITQHNGLKVVPHSWLGRARGKRIDLVRYIVAIIVPNVCKYFLPSSWFNFSWRDSHQSNLASSINITICCELNALIISCELMMKSYDIRTKN